MSASRFFIYSFKISKIHQPKAPQSQISLNKLAHVDRHIYPDNSDLSGSNANFSLYSRFRPESETASNCGTPPLLYASFLTLLWHVWMEVTMIWHNQAKQTEKKNFDNYLYQQKCANHYAFLKVFHTTWSKNLISEKFWVYVLIIIIGGSGQ